MTPQQKRVPPKLVPKLRDAYASLCVVADELDDSADNCPSCDKPTYRNWPERLAKQEIEGMIERIDRLIATAEVKR